MSLPWLAAILAIAVGASVLPAQTDTAAPPPPPAPPPQPRPPKSSSSLINEDDVEKVRGSVASAYDVVKLLRPRWLRTDVLRLPGKSGQSMQQQTIEVYMDDRAVGGLDYLRLISADQIYTLKYMSLAEVGARFGPSKGPGIVVTLK
jgi:hypothetical protein